MPKKEKKKTKKKKQKQEKEPEEKKGSKQSKDSSSKEPKNKKEQEPEESEDLEEKVDDEPQDIDPRELQRFLRASNAPSLGQVAIASQENTRISRVEQEVGTSPAGSEQEDGFKYNPNKEQEEIKYTSERQATGPERVDLGKIGTEELAMPQREAGFIHSEPQKFENRPTYILYLTTPLNALCLY